MYILILHNKAVPLNWPYNMACVLCPTLQYLNILRLPDYVYNSHLHITHRKTVFISLIHTHHTCRHAKPPPGRLSVIQSSNHCQEVSDDAICEGGK